jgi:GR25 family glycosyltransferase involved in LPS biosynthesis
MTNVPARENNKLKVELEPDQLLDVLSQVDRSSPFYSQAARVLDAHLVPERRQIPEATEPTPKKLLTIGMATYDDYDGVYFSVQAIRLYHPEITDRTEILVIDNHPEGPAAAALKQLEKYVIGYRYVPVDHVRGTAVRDRIFREANSDFALSMDCHVLFAPGSLAALLHYLETHPDSSDLLQGPLLSDDLTTVLTHFDPVWSEGMWGVWAHDDRGADPSSPPFEIPMQGLGVFACRRDAWPGFNPRLLGFGGEEGYIHERFRRAGAKTLCLPFLRWIHRFERPLGPPYFTSWEERIRNYLIGFHELELDICPAVQHFEEFVGVSAARPIVEAVQREIANPFYYFDAIYCINLNGALDRWDAVSKRFQKLGIGGLVRRFSAIETPSNHHIGCALSHRSIVAGAKKQGLRNVLVFEDDVIFTPDALDVVRNSLDELQRQKWWMLYLGGHTWGKTFEKASGCQHLEVPHGITCTHGIAYNETIFERILTDVPDTPTGVALWLKKYWGIDQYYARELDGFSLITSPVIATQGSILAQESRNFDLDPL